MNSMNSLIQIAVNGKQYHVESHILEDVKQLVVSKTTRDTFNNCKLDLMSVEKLSDKMHARACASLLPDIIASEKSKGTHVVLLTLSAAQVDLCKYAQKANFVFHQAHPDFSQLQ